MASAEIVAAQRTSVVPRPYAETADFTYIPSLDGVRAVAVLIVMLSHYGLKQVIPGAFGVTLFFFVSGFIITRLLFAEHARYGAVSVRNFYLRRFWRLVPALLTVLAVMAAFYGATRDHVSVAELAAGLFYCMNYFAIFHDTTMDFYPLWSLAVEEHYYLIFGVGFAALCGLPRRAAAIVVGVLVVVLLWRMFLVAHWGDALPEHYIEIATDTRLDSILYGAILAIGLEIPALRVWLRRLDRLPWIFLAGGGLLLTFAIRNESFRDTIRYSMQGIVMIPLFYALMFGGPLGWARRVMETRALRWVGMLSYSLYLWNLPSLTIVETALPGHAAAVNYAVAWVLTFILASLSFYLVEQPCGRLRRRFRPGVAAHATSPATA